jgi:predicted transcriptional regulator
LKLFRKCSVRLPLDLYTRIDAQAEAESCTPSDIIRSAIEQHLGRSALMSQSHRRQLRVTEYMQVAIDAIIRENHPELRETLVLEADRRMKLHHGA